MEDGINLSRKPILAPPGLDFYCNNIFNFIGNIALKISISDVTTSQKKISNVSQADFKITRRYGYYTRRNGYYTKLTVAGRSLWPRRSPKNFLYFLPLFFLPKMLDPLSWQLLYTLTIAIQLLYCYIAILLYNCYTQNVLQVLELEGYPPWYRPSLC